MLSAKDAAKRAREYLIDLLGEKRHITLEEVEMDESGGFWWVTLAYQADADEGTVFPTLDLRWKRVYKIFKISMDDGQVISMKIRSFSEQ